VVIVRDPYGHVLGFLDWAHFVNNIKTFSLYLKGTMSYMHYKDQLVHAPGGGGETLFIVRLNR
jgi:hypothetical protein